MPKNLQEEGATALHYATADGNLSVVNILLHHGADLGMWDDKGRTPLDYAIRFGHHEVASLLHNWNNAQPWLLLALCMRI